MSKYYDKLVSMSTLNLQYPQFALCRGPRWRIFRDRLDYRTSKTSSRLERLRCQLNGVLFKTMLKDIHDSYLCTGWDSNPHDLSITGPSDQRGYHYTTCAKYVGRDRPVALQRVACLHSTATNITHRFATPVLRTRSSLSHRSLT